MIRVRELKLPIKNVIDNNYTSIDDISIMEELEKKLAKTLKISRNQIGDIKIKKQSIDARKKNDIYFVYTIDVKITDARSGTNGTRIMAVKKTLEQKLVKKVNNKNVTLTKENYYKVPEMGNLKLKHPPVIIGSGPAGLFCALLLAEYGYQPIVLERGKKVEERKADVEQFFQTNRLIPNSNVQFGEGGAGTFSDGKLNTLVNDPKGRNEKVLAAFISFGAPEKISYENKPHIGTDILLEVIKNMREKIIELGGRFLFETCASDFILDENQIVKVQCIQGSGKNYKEQRELELEAEAVVLAIGHSARDTFEMLEQKGVQMEAKAFAAGFRTEHPQAQINKSQYGEYADMLPAASYKLTANLLNHRGVYTFCMCPGGYVVNASSGQGRLSVNGMSYSLRDGKNANSAVIVTVSPKDFPDVGALSGVRFQEQLEEAAYQMAGGAIPQQLLGDFIRNRESRGYGDFESQTKGRTAFAPLHRLFSKELTDSFIEGMRQFSGYIPEYDRYDCILSGVESRTSSPVRIIRDKQYQSNIRGVYPCGEGAGYAGGIMSAAMDGLKVAEAIISKYNVS